MEPEEKDPEQVTRCPCCGAPLTPVEPTPVDARAILLDWEDRRDVYDQAVRLWGAESHD